MKKNAFTLAEILIAMVIIGVVSLLMLPVLQNAQTKSLETSTAHFHSMMTQAFKHYMADNDAVSLCETELCFDPVSNSNLSNDLNSISKVVDNFMYKYLTVSKVCDYTSRYSCFNSTIKNYTESNNNTDDVKQGTNFMLYQHILWSIGSSSAMQGVNVNGFFKIYVLDNGNVIYLIPPSNRRPGNIQVDINGKKGPNRAGRDIWMMSVYADGVVSEGLHRFIMKDSYKNNPSNMMSARNGLINSKFNACKYNMNVWKYGGGCFARFEDRGFKFDY